MSRHFNKLPTEERIKIIEKYLRGDIGHNAAAREVNVSRFTISRWADLYKSDGPTALLPSQKNCYYSKELKLSAVNDYLNGEGSLQKIAQKYHIRNESQLSNWLKVYNAHRTFKSKSGGSYMSKARDTNQEERLKIVHECIANNKNYDVITLKYNVSYQQVRNWVRKYEEMGAAGLEDRRGRRFGTQKSRTPEEELRDRVAQLEREKRKLQMENDLLKKVRELERRDRLV
jgi:transposase-like protein